jgi:ferredoxin
MSADRLEVLAADDFDVLVRALAEGGREVLGPVLRDGVIAIGPVESAADLPQGWTDEQERGTYRVQPRADAAWFGYAVGPQSWKSVLFPARALLWSGAKGGVGEHGVEVSAPDRSAAARPRALLGVRSCDLAAIGIQDRVLLGRPAVDADYAARRADVIVVAVTCGFPAGTCFCASMGTGPAPRTGYDLALTELLDGEHRFLVASGSPRGAALLAALPTRVAEDADRVAGEQLVASSVARMGRWLDVGPVPAALRGALEHPRWDDVAARCLSCGSCTLVCPTCFCTAVEETTDLVGASAARTRVWDSCFTPGFSYIHGGAVRQTTRSRYRQWLTHKMSTWVDQFGTPGCVGCGRCITWCPVGIDLTEEVGALVGAHVDEPQRQDR